MPPILAPDVGPYDFYDAAQLNSDSTVVYLTLTVTSTVAPNIVNVALASDGEGILTSRDHPVRSAAIAVGGNGDLVDITGTSGGAGNGTFEVASVVSDTQFTVSGTVGNSTGGSANFRYPSGAQDVGYSQTKQNITSQNLVQPAITDISNHELLDSEPVATGTTYSNTRSGNTVTQEKWVNTSSGKTIKTIDYTYTGGKYTQEVRKVYATDGVTIIAQVTISYSYTGNTVTGETVVRNV
jgi:hypothetical protein